ncbi:MAG: DUF2892 domain-containing protein [Chloroflexi bacterium]|nr:DUF2892 domain-containing protein [Chloroflexota bacterium]
MTTGGGSVYWGSSGFLKDKEVDVMSLERGRSLVQGIMILVFAAVAVWVNQPIGLALVALVGVLKLQESVTDWCPSDVFLRAIGLKRRSASAG